MVLITVESLYTRLFRYNKEKNEVNCIVSVSKNNLQPLYAFKYNTKAFLLMLINSVIFTLSNLENLTLKLTD